MTDIPEGIAVSEPIPIKDVVVIRYQRHVSMENLADFAERVHQEITEKGGDTLVIILSAEDTMDMLDEEQMLIQGWQKVPKPKYPSDTAIYREWCTDCGAPMVPAHEPLRNVWDYICTACGYVGPPFRSAQPITIYGEAQHEAYIEYQKNMPTGELGGARWVSEQVGIAKGSIGVSPFFDPIVDSEQPKT